jgi:hypothetical protein
MTSTSYEWHIVELESKTEDGYVFTVYYAIDAKSSDLDSEDSPYTASSYSSVSLGRPNSLIPYDSLTEEIVVSWVKERLGAAKVTEIEESLEAKIEEKRHPTTGSGVPWAV